MIASQTTLPFRTALDAWFDSEAGQAFTAEFKARTWALVLAKKYISAKRIVEDMRADHWHMCVGATGLGINNTNVAPFVRLFVEKYPELEEHFERRGRV